MAVHVIPPDRLSKEALRGVIEEYISRFGTDYGETEVLPEANYRTVMQKLEKGSAIILFDDESETTNIFSAKDPAVKNLLP